MKCLQFGKILMSENRKTILLCDFCQRDYKNLEDFRQHLMNCERALHILKTKTKSINCEEGTTLSDVVFKGSQKYMIYIPKTTGRSADNVLSNSEESLVDLMVLENELADPRWYNDDMMKQAEPSQKDCAIKKEKLETDTLQHPSINIKKSGAAKSVKTSPNKECKQIPPKSDPPNKAKLRSQTKANGIAPKTSPGRSGAKNMTSPSKSPATAATNAKAAATNIKPSVKPAKTDDKFHGSKRKYTTYEIPNIVTAADEPAKKVAKLENMKESTSEKIILNSTFVPPPKPFAQPKVSRAEPNKQTYLLKSTKAVNDVEEYIIVSKPEKTTRTAVTKNVRRPTTKPMAAPEKPTATNVKILNGQNKLTAPNVVGSVEHGRLSNNQEVAASTNVLMKSRSNERNTLTAQVSALNKPGHERPKTQITKKTVLNGQAISESPQILCVKTFSPPKITSTPLRTVNKTDAPNRFSNDKGGLVINTFTEIPVTVPVQTNPLRQENQTAQILNRLHNLGVQIKKTPQPSVNQTQGSTKDSKTLALLQKLQSKGIRIMPGNQLPK